MILLLPLALSLLAASTPTPPFVPYVNHTAEVPASENKIVCVAGDTLHVAGHYTNAGFAQVILVCDHRTVSAVETGVGIGDAADYSFLWSPSEVGLHHVTVMGQLEHGRQVPLHTMLVRVIASAPGGLTPVPESTFADVPIRIVMHGSDFVPVRAAFSFAGKPVRTGSDGVSASLPVSTLPTGAYTCSAQAWDSDGEMMDVGTCALSVPERAAMTSPGAFTLSTPSDRLPLSVDVKPGLAVKSVVYYLDAQKLAESTAAPFAGSGDLSSFKSGAHDLYAQIVMADGNEFDSPHLSLSFKNQVQDDKDAAAARQEADREAAVAIAQARALAAIEAAKDEGPMGPARKLLRAYLQRHPELQMTLQDVKDVRKSDSEVYPSDIYAIVTEPGSDPRRIMFSANIATQTVSDLVKPW